MSYEGTVARISAIEKHPNADRLQLATVCGMQVIVGTTSKVGDLGICFPPGGILSDEFAEKHGLLKPSGYLSPGKARVEALKLRQVQSYGLFVPVSDAEHKLGDPIGEPICRKFIPASQRRSNTGPLKQGKPKHSHRELPRHYDTSQLWNILHMIPHGISYTVTEKLHGTSGRSGWVPKNPKTLLGKLALWFSREKHVYICGSRNVEFEPGSESGIRAQAHETLRPHIRRGEVWFYELIGWDGDKPIQPTLTDPDTKKQHSYTYGLPRGEFRTVVYRITGTDGKDLTPIDVCERVCDVDDARVPTVLGKGEHGENTMAHVSKLANLSSFAWDPELASEGAVVVFYGPKLVHAVGKLKSFKFCQMEGIAYGGADYVDPEENA